MKIWLDDIRPAPEGWIWVKSYEEATKILTMDLIISQEPIEISFDHDLGLEKHLRGPDGNPLEAPSGYTLACFFEVAVKQGKPFNITAWHIHSANPVGRRRIQQAMESFDQIRNQT